MKKKETRGKKGREIYHMFIVGTNMEEIQNVGILYHESFPMQIYDLFTLVLEKKMNSLKNFATKNKDPF